MIQSNRIWRVIINENLNIYDTFSNGKTGDVTNNPLDASWIIHLKQMVKSIQ